MTVEPHLPRRRVLLIDDDDVIADSLRRYLILQGCDVDLAVDPGSAAETMRVNAYDSIVVDPYLTGAIHGGSASLLGSIGTLQPLASTIVLTGYPSPELSRAAADCRLTAVLTKPQSIVTIGELVTAPPQFSNKGQPE
jgi:DNA-binding NtrC family response regulator